jgi:1-deoxy-D-xylulose-5-phosphate synthase
MSEVFKSTPGNVPCVVHIRTAKGHGWPPAERDNVKRMHDVSALNSKAVELSWGDLLGRELVQRAEQDSRLYVVTAAMPDTLGLTEFKRRFPERYHDVGMAEQVAVDVCAGLASRGMKPVFPVVSTFMTRTIDQLLYDVALHGLSLLVVLDRAGITGPDGPSHHGLFDIGFTARIPGTRVYAPRTENEFTGVLDSYLTNNVKGITFIRYPKGGPDPKDIVEFKRDYFVSR